MSSSRLKVILILFISFLTINASSAGEPEFQRGIYCPPYVNKDLNQWPLFGELNANVAWNYSAQWVGLNGEGLKWYMELLDQYGVKAVLRKGDAGTSQWYTDKQLFWIEHYSCGHFGVFEAEADYDYSMKRLNSGDKRYYYFFRHGEKPESNIGKTIRLESSGIICREWIKGKDHKGIVLSGPGEVSNGSSSLQLVGEQTGWPEFSIHRKTRMFKAVIHASANITQLKKDDSPVFKISVFCDTSPAGWSDGGISLIAEKTFTGEDFKKSAFSEFKRLEIDYGVPDSPEINGKFSIHYSIEWFGKCDLRMDKIEYMDKDRGYWLFYQDDACNYVYRDSILYKVILPECRGLEEKYGDQIVGWAQSDEPGRWCYRSHGVINRFAEENLKAPTITPLVTVMQGRSPELFVQLANPKILDVDSYPFRREGERGDQSELDHLAEKFELWYKTCGDSIELHYTAQAHGSPGQNQLRLPTRAEIQVAVFMAVAHGVKGINFYKYTTYKEDGKQNYGIVDPRGRNDEHAYATYFERWTAVHDFFDFLEVAGPVLLRLKRDYAYCLADTKKAAFLNPVKSIAFTDGAKPYIEVGQFHDTAGSPYLMVVNRLTLQPKLIDISLQNSRSSEEALTLQDLYSGEVFEPDDNGIVSIAFDAGEGRLLKIAYDVRKQEK